MKKLVDLLREISQEELDAMLPGEYKDGYRKNKNSDRVNKIGGSVPANWKDRKAGVDFDPNPEILDIRGKYDANAAKMKANNTSNRPKKRNDGEIWDFRDWILFPPKPQMFLDSKEEVLEIIKDFLKDAIESADAEGNYQPLDQEDLEKCLSSLTMDKAGNLHFYGPYRISYNRNVMSALEAKVNEMSGVDPKSYGKVKKAKVLSAANAANDVRVQKRLAKPEEDGQD